MQLLQRASSSSRAEQGRARVRASQHLLCHRPTGTASPSCAARTCAGGHLRAGPADRPRLVACCTTRPCGLNHASEPTRASIFSSHTAAIRGRSSTIRLRPCLGRCDGPALSILTEGSVDGILPAPSLAAYLPRMTPQFRATLWRVLSIQLVALGLLWLLQSRYSH